jgi:hypothetical protein
MPDTTNDATDWMRARSCLQSPANNQSPARIFAKVRASPGLTSGRLCGQSAVAWGRSGCGGPGSGRPAGLLVFPVLYRQWGQGMIPPGQLLFPSPEAVDSPDK